MGTKHCVRGGNGDDFLSHAALYFNLSQLGERLKYLAREWFLAKQSRKCQLVSSLSYVECGALGLENIDIIWLADL